MLLLVNQSDMKYHTTMRIGTNNYVTALYVESRHNMVQSSDCTSRCEAHEGLH